MVDYGRSGHTDNDRYLLFVGYVAEKLKSMPRHMWPQAFYSLTINRDDVENLRVDVWEKLK